jgi:hypothetical protein
MKDGSSLFDHFGKGFTLISLDDEINGETLAAAAKERGIPFQVVTTSGSDREALVELYQARAALVRSDHHVAWRGHQLPSDIENLLYVLTGYMSWKPLAAGATEHRAPDSDG